MKEKFDIVLFDSPPIIAVTDAAVLSSQLDGVILVIKSGQTDREAAFRAYSLLKNVKTRIIGALLNGVHIESMYGSYYYYYHYYYYGKDGEKKRKQGRSRSRKQAT
jgi:Mrp family chromosome partitioning ATPase